jgi:hypothetical protein
MSVGLFGFHMDGVWYEPHYVNFEMAPSAMLRESHHCHWPWIFASLPAMGATSSKVVACLFLDVRPSSHCRKLTWLCIVEMHRFSVRINIYERRLDWWNLDDPKRVFHLVVKNGFGKRYFIHILEEVKVHQTLYNSTHCIESKAIHSCGVISYTALARRLVMVIIDHHEKWP